MHKGAGNYGVRTWIFKIHKSRYSAAICDAAGKETEGRKTGGAAVTHNAKVEADGAASCAGRASNDGLEILRR